MSVKLSNEGNSQLWLQLTEHDCIEKHENSLEPMQILSIPWYLAVLQGGAGWVAALFSLGFMASFTFLLFGNGSEMAGFMVMGTIYLFIGLYIDRKCAAQQYFLQQLAFVCQLSGLLAMGWVLLDWFSYRHMLPFYSLYTLILVAYCLASRNVLGIFVNGLSMAACIGGIFYELQILSLLPLVLLALAVLLCLNILRFPRYYQRLLILSYAFSSWAIVAQVLVKLSGENINVIDNELFTLSIWSWLLPWLFSLVVSVYLVFTIFQQRQLSLQSRQGYCALAGIVFLGVISIPMSGLNSALLFLLLGLYMHDKVISVLGICSLPVFMSVYYYSLHATLLEKSLLLMGLGLLMLLARWMVSRLLHCKIEAA